MAEFRYFPTASAPRTSLFRYVLTQGAIILVLIAFLGALATGFTYRVVSQDTAFRDHHLPLFQTAARLQASVMSMAALSTRHLTATTRGELRTLADRMTDHSAQAKADIDRLVNLGMDEAWVTRARSTHEDLLTSAITLDALVLRIIEMDNRDTPSRDLQEARQQRNRLIQRQELLASELTTLVTSLARNAELQLTRHQDEAAVQGRVFLAAITATSIGSILIVILLYRGLRRSVLDRLHVLTAGLMQWRSGEATSLRLKGPNDEIAELADTLSNLITAVERQTEALSAQAITDPLTGLLNRRGLEARAAEELSRAGRHDKPLVALIGDIDHFKSVNDRFGHACGDGVLRRIAEVWQGVLRDIDISGRIGGEEFAALLPDTDAPAGMVVAERIREAVSRLQLTDDQNRPLTCTISLGLTAYAPGDTLPGLLSRADAALYDAKSCGRNAVRARLGDVERAVLPDAG